MRKLQAYRATTRKLEYSEIIFNKNIAIVVLSEREKRMQSYVLLAMGLPLDQIESAVRISWDADTDKEELRRQFLDMLEVAKGLA